jgi:hypothetical protein
MSPIRSPWYSSGVVTSTPMIGSSRIGLRLLHRFLEGEDARHLEREFRRIDLVEGAVDDANDDVDHRISGDHTIIGTLEDAFGRGLDEFLRNRPPTIFVDHLDALALFVGLELDDNVAVLALATGLADELALGLRGLVTVSR